MMHLNHSASTPHRSTLKWGTKTASFWNHTLRKRSVLNPDCPQHLPIFHLQTNETVGAIKADVDWIRLKGTRSIDTSVVAGFMFQTDSGTGCSITITENENRPIRILIDETQGFAIFLVVVLRHEKWTTSGLFHLRFVRRVPISAKKCTARMDEPVVTSSGSGTSSGEKPMSVADDSRDIEEDGELASAPKGGKLASATKDLRDIEEWMEQTAAALNEENGATGDTDQVAFTNDSHMVPLSRQPEDSKDGDTTDEEDWRAIGADARIMPANWRPPAN